MSRHLWSYSSIMFFTSLTMGILISISSSNWFTMWMGMELNIYSFIPLMLSSSSFKEKEAAIKYLFAQAIPSSLILLLAISNQYINYLFPISIMMALGMKLGMAPTHFWFPSVMNSLSWSMCFILTTLQKITPFLIMFNMPLMSKNLMLLFIMSSALMGGIGGLNQTQLRPILAYSSIGHMSWITATSMVSTKYAISYFVVYMIIITSIFLYISTFNNLMINQNFNLLQSNIQTWAMIFLLMSLGGLPPLMGFFPKLMTINILAMTNNYLVLSSLIMGSLMNLYYYFKMTFSLIMSTPNFFLLKKYNNLLLPYFTSILISLSSISSLPLLYLMLI